MNTQATINTPLKLRDILHLLINNRQVKSGSDLARQLDLPAPTINRILSGHVQDPRASTLTLLADYFGVTIDQLLGKAALPSDIQEISTPLKPSIAIPVISTDLTTNLQTSLSEVKDWFRWTTEKPSHSSDVFAVRVSHRQCEPVFQKGSLLVINPALQPQEHDFVAVQFEQDNHISIRKYRQDGRETYFYPLQPEHKVIAANDIAHTILGVVIEAHINLARQ